MFRFGLGVTEAQVRVLGPSPMVSLWEDWFSCLSLSFLIYIMGMPQSHHSDVGDWVQSYTVTVYLIP